MNLETNHVECGCANDSKGKLVDIFCPVKIQESQLLKYRKALEKIAKDCQVDWCSCFCKIAKEALRT